MFNGEKLVVDLSREFIDSAGAKHYSKAIIGAVEQRNPFSREIEGETLKEKVCNNLKDPNGFAERPYRDVRLNYRTLYGADAVRRLSAVNRDAGVRAEASDRRIYRYREHDGIRIQSFHCKLEPLPWSGICCG
jgi:hypothetical protein